MKSEQTDLEICVDFCAY